MLHRVKYALYLILALGPVKYTVMHAVVAVRNRPTEVRPLRMNNYWRTVSDLQSSFRPRSTAKQFCQADRASRKLAPTAAVEETFDSGTYTRRLFSLSGHPQRSATERLLGLQGRSRVGAAPAHVAVVILESLRYTDLSAKLPRLMDSLQTEFRDRIAIHRLSRCGPNSVANRCPLLTGREETGGRCSTDDSLYLDRLARAQGYSTFLGEVRDSRDDITYLEHVLLGSSGSDAIHSLVREEWCPKPPECPTVPVHGSDALASSCGPLSAFDVVYRHLEEHVATRGPTLSISNFYDFHHPYIDYTSPDLDAFLRTFANATVFILGDHGHGMRDGGEAPVLVRFRPDHAQLPCFQDLPVVTTRTVHRFVHSALLGRCTFHAQDLTQESELVAKELVPLGALPPPLACPSNASILLQLSGGGSSEIRVRVAETRCHYEPSAPVQPPLVQALLEASCGDEEVLMSSRIDCTGELTPMLQPETTYKRFFDCIVREEGLNFAFFLSCPCSSDRSHHFSVNLVPHPGTMPRINEAALPGPTL